MVTQPSIYKGSSVYQTGAGGGGENLYKIGDKYYHAAKIAGKLWILENLDFVWDELQFGGNQETTDPHAYYYNNDKDTYGFNGYKCGLLYNWYAVKYLYDNRNTLIQGWRPASVSDWDYISNSLVDAGTQIKSKDRSWFSGWNGTDFFDFAALPAGEFNENQFKNIGTRARFWTSNQYGDSNAYRKFLAPNTTTLDQDNVPKTCGASVRLVEDI